MAIKLHYHPLSTYSRRVLIALIEKQISYEPVPLDMTARKHREPPYLALNPYGRVPTLEEDGFVLYESTAIIFPKRFLPKQRWNETAMAQAKAEVEKHLAVVERQLGGGKFLVGDRFTLADLCYLPFLEFLPLAEIEPPPAVAAWTERLLTRPSALETKPEH